MTAALTLDRSIVPATASLRELESVIERGLETFVEVGNALAEIRDNRLYRESHGTFEDYCRERWGWGRDYADKQIAASKIAMLLPTTVGKLPSERVVRELAPYANDPEALQDVWLETVEVHGPAPTAAQVREVVAERTNKPHVSNNSGNNEWYTPAPFIEAARLAMGSIDTDPASSEIANRTVQAGQYFDADANGLRQRWYGSVWMNPPYSQPLISEFCEAVTAKFLSGEIGQACVLVNNATETAWFQCLLSEATAVCFPRSRIRYNDSTGTPGNSPLQGQAVVYFGGRKAEFAAAFSGIGKVLYG